MNSERTILITGFMGSGKTEVARKLAKLLRREMYDLDHVIARSEGRSPAKLIAEEGEDFFRLIETRTLRQLLQRSSASVIALGGGAWIQNENRELIKIGGGVCVWLNIPFEVCWKRIEASEEDRPLGKTKHQAMELFQRRHPVYELADLHLQFVPDESSRKLAMRAAHELAIYHLI